MYGRRSAQLQRCTSSDTTGALQPGGVIFSIIGAVLILLVWRAIDRRRTPAA